MTTDFHSVVNDSPAIQALTREAAESARKYQKARHRQSEELRAWEAAERDLKLARSAAAESGEPAPRSHKVAVPDYPAHAMANDAARESVRRLADREAEILAEHSDEFSADIRKRYDSLINVATKLVEQLGEIATEVEQLRSSTDAIRAATDDHRPVTKGAVNAVPVASAVLAGGDFLSPDAVAQRVNRDSRIEVDNRGRASASSGGLAGIEE